MDTPVAPAKKTSKPGAARHAAPEAGTLKTEQPKKELVRTLLVASCGWPTEADLPNRKRAARR